MTSGAAAAMQRKTIAIVNVARVIASCSYHFVIAVWRAKEAESAAVKYWEMIADNLKKAGWSLGLRFSDRFQRANNLDCGRAFTFAQNST